MRDGIRNMGFNKDDLVWGDWDKTEKQGCATLSSESVAITV
jgi:hypothetical protein